MVRIVLILALSLAVPLGAQVAPGYEGDVHCEQGCTDDGADGKCAPNCTDCSCCPHVQTLQAIEMNSTIQDSTGETSVELPAVFIASRGPNKIRHVPKS